jgi:hypothetical protein
MSPSPEFWAAVAAVEATVLGQALWLGRRLGDLLTLARIHSEEIGRLREARHRMESQLAALLAREDLR